MNNKSVSLKSAIFDVVVNFANRGNKFSSHDITRKLRSDVNSGKIEIPEIATPIGADAFLYDVKHQDVKSSFLELHFDVKGTLELPCDVSMELFNYPIDADYDLIVKFGTPNSQITDEILILPEGSYQINVAQYFYEMVVLNLPLKRVHPGIEDGTLQSEILDKLKALEPKETHLKGSEDPRWNKLKDLL